MLTVPAVTAVWCGQLLVLKEESVRATLGGQGATELL